MSTLDYAHRAKNIKNKPEVNQKMTKRVLLREYSSTIERLKAELQATREKNGVYLPIEQYQKMEMNLQGQSSQLTELEVRLVACRGWWRVHGRVCCVCAGVPTPGCDVGAPQTVLETRQKELKEIQAMFNITKEELEAARAEASARLAELQATQATLTETKVELEETKDTLGETEFVLEGHATKESQLRTEAVQLQQTLGVSKTDVGGLWAKIGASVAAGGRRPWFAPLTKPPGLLSVAVWVATRPQERRRGPKPDRSGAAAGLHGCQLCLSRRPHRSLPRRVCPAHLRVAAAAARVPGVPERGVHQAVRLRRRLVRRVHHLRFTARQRPR